MKLSNFDYHLERHRIAQRPMHPRDSSRLFYLKKNEHIHLTFNDLPDLLNEGDVLVRNVSKVIPARVEGKKETGGHVEILFYQPLDGGWECLIKGAKIKEGINLLVDGEIAKVKKRLAGGRYVVDCKSPINLMMSHGKMPTPPYIKKELSSPDEYQTVYAVREGSIAAPTAGFHFTPELLEKISGKGVDIHDITLHVGPGTFLPVRTDEVEGHDMEEESFEVNEETAQAVTSANEEGRRVIFVGTTTVRAMESVSSKGKVSSRNGRTDLFIYPGYEFQSGMDMLLTNFHLPKSTLLMLVSAFGGRERILSAYREAIKKEYRFYSFGDAMLIEGLQC